jgi:hypothetical protein
MIVIKLQTVLDLLGKIVSESIPYCYWMNRFIPRGPDSAMHYVVPKYGTLRFPAASEESTQSFDNIVNGFWSLLWNYAPLRHSLNDSREVSFRKS